MLEFGKNNKRSSNCGEMSTVFLPGVHAGLVHGQRCNTSETVECLAGTV